MNLDRAPPGSTAHRQTQIYLFTELQKYADNVELQPCQYEVGGVVLRLNNILAEFGPKAEATPLVPGGELNRETLLLAAHWDTRPLR